MSSLRHCPCSPPTASPLDLDDLLREILLRLPPQPSSLPRASAVCKGWRLLVTDPRFLRRFRIHHRRSPPLIGFFIENILPCRDLSFEPTLELPNHAPVKRFSLQPQDGGLFRFLSCRHGLVLIILRKRNKVLIWDPVTGNQRHIAVPPGFEMVLTSLMNGAVLHAAGDARHFQVVLIGTYQEQQDTRVVARVYSSETGLWGNVISTSVSSHTYICRAMRCVMVGNSLYWLLSEKSSGILEFDLDRESLTRIPVPLDIYAKGNGRFTVMRAEGGGLGFLFLSGYDAQLWNCKKDSDGVVSWALTRNIQLGNLLSLKP
ncbi:hypothetical protein QYE76_027268 [Lolium multiflorum]|uniref:F-box domain-containing protein n=1 Tax=Lolium multiflorum TaxID=4521 RepID=A0AAD8VBJ2_LOLMU|nr:hypothetical protein QYE76_027268 [Lolium multiflorum]